MKANSAFKQPSNQVSQFSKIPQANIARSRFDLSHTHKGTMVDAGLLQVFDLYEVLPGDTFVIQPTVYVRLTTQLAPVMDNAYLDIFYFFVMNRIVWSNWQRFMGERDPDPDSSIDYAIPQIESPGTGWPEGSLADTFGLPTLVAATMSINALPFRGYNAIWNAWFRDQQMQDSVVVDLDDGPDSAADYASVLRRGKRHDFFTACLPSPQKGDTVYLPLQGDAPITGLGVANGSWTAGPANSRETDQSSTTVYDSYRTSSDPANPLVYRQDGSTGYPDIHAALSEVSAATINELREAFQIQKVLERDSRGGTRYFELIQSHFGVTDPASLVPTRPIFLGGSSTPFNQSTVAQTTYQGTETRLDAKGALAANSVFISRFKGITASFTEHGYLFGLMNIRCDISYQQGIDRHWLRETRYDYYLPSLAHLGEQAVESREIYYDGSGSSTAEPPTGDYSIFGYIPRFDELRFSKNIISGMLKSNSSLPLDYHHFAQDFASRPTLSDAFIQDKPPISRVTAITPSATSPAFMFDAYVKATAVRAMPSQAVPGLIDHF